MLSVSEIKTFIDQDSTSERKKFAQVGQRYYDGVHDIMGKRLFFINADGKLEEEKFKSNTRISHPFFTELTDQVVQHLFSGEDGFIRSDDPGLQKELDARFNNNDEFKAEFEEICTGCVAKGFENAYAYKDGQNRTRFSCADSLGVVKVMAKDTDDHCEYVIRWYIEHIDKNSKQIKRIEVWDKEKTWFYCQVDDGEITPDESEEVNPRPHTTYKKKGDERIYYKGFGFIPFLQMNLNRKQVSGLALVKDIIDDYDTMNCGLSNNINDTNEALYVVSGFEGDKLEELMENIKTKKHIGVSENGSVQIETVDIPIDARKAKMEIDEKNIYHFGFGLNISDLKDAAATTNMMVRAAYVRLDMRTHKLKTQAQLFLRDVLDIVLPEINAEKKTDYQQSDVYFSFEPEPVSSALENAQIELTEAQRRQTEINTVLNLQAFIDDETRLQLIAEQLDMDFEALKNKKPKVTDPAYQAKTALDKVKPEDVQGGEGDVVV